MDDFLTKEENCYKFPHMLSVSPFIAKKYNDYLYGGTRTKNLYHYTNLDGLMGILKNTCFWATHTDFLNDSVELRHGIQLCFDVIEEKASQTVDKYEISFLYEIKQKIIEEKRELFLVSFCANGDLLSQWRGYSRGEYGVSIGFNYSELAGHCTTQYINNHIIPNKVIYDTKIQKQIIEDIICIGIKALNYEGVEWDKSYRIEVYPELLVQTLFIYIPLLKHPSFAEEKEYRFVVHNFQQDGKENIKKSYRIRENVILPYAQLDIITHDKESSRKLPIDKIIIGPSKSQDLTRKSIDYFLSNNGYSYVETEFSSIPYR
jgi:hypothetical protein